MHSFLEMPLTGAALFHSRICNFLITPNGNDSTPKWHDASHRFLAAISRRVAEVSS